MIGQDTVSELSTYRVSVLGDKEVLDVAALLYEENSGGGLKAVSANAMMPIGLTLPLTFCCLEEVSLLYQ